MELFWNTVMIVSGILAPFAVGVLIIAFYLYGVGLVVSIRRSHELKMERERKQPPYDDVELSQPPNPSMFTIRLIKDGEVVWEESYDKDIKERS